MIKPTIEKYLLSTCLFIIDDFNEFYGNRKKEELKNIADHEFNEMDICVRIGYPFKNMAHYTKGDKNENIEEKAKINHDIYIKSKDFKIEVKYLKQWGISRSKNWSKFKEDFDWLEKEIIAENKGNRAFVIGWFNYVDRFSRLMQLGQKSGRKTLASEEKTCYFPFLHKSSSPTYTTDLVYKYNQAYRVMNVDLIGHNDIDMNCLFLGNEEDIFHFAIYY